MEDNEARNDWALPDARLLTEHQRQELCKILFNALLEIRMLGREGKAEQAADIADAFHNLPIYLWSDKFSLSLFRRFLEEYQQKYSERRMGFDYVKMLDEIAKEG
ncbi:MAG: hypothetical protein ACREA2_11815 [Blastocatellia bacterium]